MKFIFIFAFCHYFSTILIVNGIQISRRSWVTKISLTYTLTYIFTHVCLCLSLYRFSMLAGLVLFAFVCCLSFVCVKVSQMRSFGRPN